MDIESTFGEPQAVSSPCTCTSPDLPCHILALALPATATLACRAWGGGAFCADNANGLPAEELDNCFSRNGTQYGSGSCFAPQVRAFSLLCCPESADACRATFVWARPW